MNGQQKYIIGHEKNEEFLDRLIERNAIPGAFLFSGPRGLGKASMASIFAAKVFSNTEALQAEQEASLFGEEERPKSLKFDTEIFEQIKNNSFPDFLHITKQEDNKNITIDEVREINKFLNLSPAVSNNRVVVIDSADDLNISSSNALLKSLEEPTKNSIIIMICHNRSSLLPTIISRCCEVKFSALKQEQFQQVIDSKDLSEEFIRELGVITSFSPGMSQAFAESEVEDLYRKLKSFFGKRNFNNIGEINEISKILKENNNNYLFFKLYLSHMLSQRVKQKQLETKDWFEVNKAFRESENFNIDHNSLIKNIISII